VVAIIPDFASCNVVEHPARRAGKFAFFSISKSARNPNRARSTCTVPTRFNDLRCQPSFLFAHAAGAPSSHPWMVRWAELLRTIGSVVAFDCPYLAEGRKRPDPLPKLIEAHRAALERERHSHSGPVVLIGKSVGGRVGCHLSLQEAAAAVVRLGYPLCGGGDCGKRRDKALRELSTPIAVQSG
jgi:predicted alpha/beta-hydrolase family hydrolase